MKTAHRVADHAIVPRWEGMKYVLYITISLQLCGQIFHRPNETEEYLDALLPQSASGIINQTSASKRNTRLCSCKMLWKEIKRPLPGKKKAVGPPRLRFYCNLVHIWLEFWEVIICGVINFRNWIVPVKREKFSWRSHCLGTTNKTFMFAREGNTYTDQ